MAGSWAFTSAPSVRRASRMPTARWWWSTAKAGTTRTTGRNTARDAKTQRPVAFGPSLLEEAGHHRHGTHVGKGVAGFVLNPVREGRKLAEPGMVCNRD